MQPVIRKIVGLFSKYNAKEVVTNEEYNANIRTLQEAIETNAEALAEQQEYSKALVNAAIPAGGITTEHIAPYAITTDKLTPALQEHTHVESMLSDFCKDYVPSYLYKTMPATFTGPLFNSHISALNKKLTYKPNCTVSVSHDNAAGWFVKYDDEGNGMQWCTTALNNTASPKTFDINFTTGDRAFRHYTGGWVVTYDLGAPWDIGELTDFISINWKYISVFGTYKNSYVDRATSDVSAILIRDKDGANILKDEELYDISKYFKTESVTKKYDDRHETSVNCAFMPNLITTKLTGVRYIDFYIKYTYTHRGERTVHNGIVAENVLKMPTNVLTNTIQLSKITEGAVPNSKDLTASVLVPCKGSLEHLTVAAKINAPNITRAFTEDEIVLNIPYMGIAPAPLLSSEKLYTTAYTYNALVNDTVHSELIKAQFIEDILLEDNTHLVKWVIEPYYISTGTFGNDAGDLAGATYSYFDCNNMLCLKKMANLTAVLTFDNDSIILTPFTPGIDSVQLNFQSTITDLTINSVCVARHDSDI